MLWKVLPLVALLGLTACAPTTISGVCEASRRDRERLAAALKENPATPNVVGEAGVDLIVGLRAVCA